MGKASHNKTTQFDEIEEQPRFKKKPREKKRVQEEIFIEEENHWLNKKKNKNKHNRSKEDYDNWN